MAKRTGVSSLYSVSRTLCKLITKFTPILTQLYGGNAALMAALEAATAACSVLALELQAVIDYGD